MPIKLVRRAKSPNWVMRGTLRGIRVEESTRTDNKKKPPNKFARRARAKSSPNPSTVVALPRRSPKRR
jgi:hypothetical protein